MSYASEILADSPKRYIRMGDASGTTAVDAAGVANGTYSGTPGLNKFGMLTSDAGKCVLFDGVDDTVILAGHADFNFGSGDFAFECWITSTNIGSGFNMIAGSNAGSEFWFFGIQFGRLIWNGSGWGTAKVNDGIPHYVAVVRVSGVRTLYVDGVLDDSASDTAAYGDSGSVVTVGSWAGAYFFPGRMQEFALYKGTVPDATRIAAHYTASGGRVLLTSATSHVKAGDAGKSITITGSGTSWVQGVTNFTCSQEQYAGDGRFITTTVTSTTVNSSTSVTLDFDPFDHMPISGQMSLIDPDGRSIPLTLDLPYTYTDHSGTGYAGRVYKPTTWNGSDAIRLVQYFHGLGESGNLTYVGWQNILNRLTAKGYLVAAFDHGSNTFGNATSSTLTGAWMGFMASTYSMVTNITLWGGSMGGLDALREYADYNVSNHIPNMVGCFLIYPVCSLDSANDGPLNSQFVLAYPSYPTGSTDRDPILFPSSVWADKSLLYFASPDDATVPKSENADPMNAITVTTAASSTVIVHTGGHGDFSASQPGPVQAFVDALVSGPDITPPTAPMLLLGVG